MSCSYCFLVIVRTETLHSYRRCACNKLWSDPELSFDITSGVEADFRERYSMYLKHMRQRIYDTHIGFNELEDERRFVNQQVIKTPGRRGEFIKNEEIDKEFSRRFGEYKKIMDVFD
jgi:hypothetical protein